MNFSKMQVANRPAYLTVDDHAGMKRAFNEVIAWAFIFLLWKIWQLLQKMCIFVYIFVSFTKKGDLFAAHIV